jgi:hypothetical protein
MLAHRFQADHRGLSGFVIPSLFEQCTGQYGMDHPHGIGRRAHDRYELFARKPEHLFGAVGLRLRQADASVHGGLPGQAIGAVTAQSGAMRAVEMGANAAQVTVEQGQRIAPGVGSCRQG